MTDEEIRVHMDDLVVNVAEQVANRFDQLWRKRTDELDHKWTDKVVGIKNHVDLRVQSGIAQKLGKLETGQRQIREELQDTRVELKANIRRLETTLARMEGRSDRVEVRMDRLEVRQEEMKVALDRFVTDHETQPASLEIGLADQSPDRR